MIMTTYRFNRKYIREFATEVEANEHSLGYDDNVQATIERLNNGHWEIFTETPDGNGAWRISQVSWAGQVCDVLDERSDSFLIRFTQGGSTCQMWIGKCAQLYHVSTRHPNIDTAKVPRCGELEDERYQAELQRQAENNLGGIHYQPSGIVEEAHWQYRGWEIIKIQHTGRFSIRRDGWQGRDNLKSLEAAKFKIDDIVG